MRSFFIALISIYTLMHVYVFWRIATIPFVTRNVPKTWLVLAGVCLWAIVFLVRLVGRHGTGTAILALEFFGMNWMAVMFLTFVCLLAIDLVTGFGFFLPRIAPSLRGWALAAAGLLSAIALFQGMRAPVVENYHVTLSGLPAEMDGSVIVAMSDLHVGRLRGKDWLAARVAQVRKERPDMVVLLGDYFEGHDRPQEELLAVMKQLSAPLGVWAVPGNHENHRGRDLVMPRIEKEGIGVLINRSVEVQPGFVLAGVEDLTSRYRSGRKGDLVLKVLKGRPSGATVFLSHTPWQAETAAKAGAGLMLSGHTHGGQIWPFGYITRRFYPLLAGQYEVDGMTVIVNRGTGVWGPLMRLWHPGEISRITLHSGK
ncbi:MAG: metallophosphoesterase [Desulfobacterales bacterium]